jgi:hypothetical protein
VPALDARRGHGRGSGAARGLITEPLIGDLPEVYLRGRAAEAFDWALFGALLARMRDTAAREGAQFFFFEHPDVAEIWPPTIEEILERLGVPEHAYDPFAIERQMAAVSAQRGVDFVPVVGAFRAAASRGPFHLLPHDRHLNPAGHALLAKLLADAVEARLAHRARTP